MVVIKLLRWKTKTVFQNIKFPPWSYLPFSEVCSRHTKPELHPRLSMDPKINVKWKPTQDSQADKTLEKGGSEEQESGTNIAANGKDALNHFIRNLVIWGLQTSGKKMHHIG